MNAISKKLLSMLVVLAMVLSMVPFGGLGILAVETNATEVAQTFDPANNEGVAYCPACQKEVTWEVYAGGKDADSGLWAEAEDAHFHLYLAEDLTYTTNALVSWRNVCFNLNGHNVTAADTTAKYAFNCSRIMNLMDTEGGAVVTGSSTSMYEGAAVHVNSGATAVCNIYGGTYKKLAANATSAIVYIANNGGKVNMYDGAVIDARGTTNNKNCSAPAVGLMGNASVKAEFTMYGGTIYGGTGVNCGGAVTVGMWFSTTGYQNGAVFTMKGGTVDGGATTVTGTEANAEYGGNFKVQYGGTLNLEGGTVKNGSAYKNGGAIFVTAGTLNMSGDATVYAGDVTSGGFDGIALANASTMTMSGNSKVYGTGTSWGNALYVYNGSTLILSGNATVKNETGSSSANIYVLYNATTPNNLRIANDWAGEAYMFTEKGSSSGRYAAGDTIDSTTGGYCGALSDGAIPTPGGTYAGRLYYSTTGTLVLGEEGALVVSALTSIPEVGKFEPEKNNGMAYCPACMAQGTNLQPVEWTVYTGEYNTTATKLTGGEHAHLYLTADLSYAAANYALISDQNVCFNLNGCDITAASGAYSAFDVSATLNLMDTAGGAVVTGNSTSMYVGSAVHVNNAATTCNIYGGTYTKLAADTNSAIVYIANNGGKVNMYDGAVIDARNLANISNRAAPSVGLMGNSSAKAEFTMYGGTIYGGTGVNGGGAVTVGMWFSTAGYQNGAVFTMKGGTVDGGATTVTGTDSNAEYGGNFKVQYGGTLNLEGGTVKNGSAYKYGGAIFVTAGTLNMSGDATVYAGDVTSGGFDGIVLANASTMTMSGNSKVYGTGTGWGNALYAYNGSTVTLSGNATVKNESGSSGSNIYILYSTSKPNNLRIANDWAGEAYMFTEKDGDGGRYASGDTIDSTYGGYCGALADGTVTKGGSFNGSLYLGNYGIFGENGDLILGVTSVVSKDGTTKWYASNQAAVDAAANNPNAYVLMSSSDTVTLSGDTYILINGHNITVNGSGTLYPMDKANDDFDGYGSFTVDETNITIETDVTNPVNGYRYAIMRNAAGKYNAHRIEIKLTAVTLRAGEAGLYYKAEYKCDDALAGRISAYGVVLSVKDMPDADFLYSTDGFSCLESGFVPDEDHVVTATSGSVFGIFKDAAERPATEEKTTAQLNAEYGMKTIYANAYFLVDLQGDGDTTNDNVYVSDTKNGGKQKHDSAAANYDADFDGVAYSLWDVMKTINDQWDTLIGDDENKQGLIKNFLDTWMNDEVVDSSIWDWSELPEITALGA